MGLCKKCKRTSVLIKIKFTKNLSNKDKGGYFFGEQDGGINPLHPNIRMLNLHTGRICAIFSRVKPFTPRSDQSDFHLMTTIHLSIKR